jgi:hypothetical protein
LTPKEEDECIVFAEYLRARMIPFTHIANERRTSWGRGAKLKSMGVSAGFPDYIVFPGDGIVIFIEMKRTKEYKVSDAQKQWIEFLNSYGVDEKRNTHFVAAICYGADHAIEVVKKVINIINKELVIKNGRAQLR